MYIHHAVAVKILVKVKIFLLYSNYFLRFVLLHMYFSKAFFLVPSRLYIFPVHIFSSILMRVRRHIHFLALLTSTGSLGQPPSPLLNVHLKFCCPKSHCGLVA